MLGCRSCARSPAKKCTSHTRGNRWAGLHEVLEVIDRLGTHIPRGKVAGDGYTLDLCA